jgi:hypothetical protein
MNAALRLLLLACLVSVACATTETVLRLYPGPPRPSSEVATLRNKAGNLWAVDGVNPRCGICQGISLELLPGSHSLSVEIGGAGTGVATQPVTVSFVAEAGHAYELSGQVVSREAGGGTWTPEIRDISAGKVVSP